MYNLWKITYKNVDPVTQRLHHKLLLYKWSKAGKYVQNEGNGDGSSILTTLPRYHIHSLPSITPKTLRVFPNKMALYPHSSHHHHEADITASLTYQHTQWNRLPRLTITYWFFNLTIPSVSPFLKIQSFIAFHNSKAPCFFFYLCCYPHINLNLSLLPSLKSTAPHLWIPHFSTLFFGFNYTLRTSESQSLSLCWILP